MPSLMHLCSFIVYTALRVNVMGSPPAQSKNGPAPAPAPSAQAPAPGDTLFNVSLTLHGNGGTSKYPQCEDLTWSLICCRRSSALLLPCRTGLQSYTCMLSFRLQRGIFQPGPRTQHRHVIGQQCERA